MSKWDIPKIKTDEKRVKISSLMFDKTVIDILKENCPWMDFRKKYKIIDERLKPLSKEKFLKYLHQDRESPAISVKNGKVVNGRHRLAVELCKGEEEILITEGSKPSFLCDICSTNEATKRDKFNEPYCDECFEEKVCKTCGTPFDE